MKTAAPKRPIESYSRHIKGLSYSRLSASAFHELASSLTYCVWSGDPATYRLTASATFVDGLAYGKPGIYSRNDYIENYCQRLGNVGYVFDNYRELRQIVTDILDDFPTELYREQVSNVKAGSALFSPESLAPKLREVIEACAVGAGPG